MKHLFAPGLSPIRPQLLFNTRFEGTNRLAAAAGPSFHGAPEQYRDFHGADPTVATPNDWAIFTDHPVLGTFRIYYEGGNEHQRWARILADDTNPTEHFLRFHLAEPNVTLHWPEGAQHKSRIQTELYGSVGLRELYQSVRIRFPAASAKLRDYPGIIKWFTLAEFWANAGWTDEPYAYRFGLHLIKPDPAPGTDLYFSTESEIQPGPQHFEKVWHHENLKFPLPFDTWMTLETYYREGDESSGRYFVAITPDHSERTVLFDVHGYTHHPANPNPSGMKHYSPLKLYTSAEVVNFLRAQGTALEVDWDDFSLWSNREPETSVP